MKEKIPLSNGELNAQLTHLLRYTYLYLLIRFKLRYRQVSIITHTDFDGTVSAAMVMQRFPQARIYYTSPSNLYHAIYAAGRACAPDIPHTLYILDLTIDETYRTRLVKAIRDLRAHVRTTDIVWVDHHRTRQLDEAYLAKYVRVYHDPFASYAAFLVYKHINCDPAVAPLLDILQNKGNPYWRKVLQGIVEVLHTEWRLQAVRDLATLTKTPFTDELYQKQVQTNPAVANCYELYETKQGFKFGLLNFQESMDLYQKVREIIYTEQLDFILVQFRNGTLSAYKNSDSMVNLIPLMTLVGGKGHAYAFHFAPQFRINDEFFRMTTIPELITRVQEIL